MTQTVRGFRVSSPPEMSLCLLEKLGYTAQRAKPGSARSFRNPTRNPNVPTFREPHPGQNIRPPKLHRYLHELLLEPDEFMQLLQDC